MIKPILASTLSLILVFSIVQQSYASVDTSADQPSTSVVGDCSKIPMSQLRGVAFIDPILSRDERGKTFSGSPTNYVQKSMEYLKFYKFNLVRVPYYWESYVYSPTDFMNRLRLIAQSAQNNGICVVFDNHHYFASSFWTQDKPALVNRKGFPSFVVEDYPAADTYELTAGPFWTDFLNNNIPVNGRKVWDVQAAFLIQVIKKVNGFSSVAGYEILNEPHLFDMSQYAKLGAYHTYIAKKMRTVTDKPIFFSRENTFGFPRDPNSESKIVPQGVTKLVYSPHLYAVPTPGSQGEKQINNFKTWATQWRVQVMIGEFSAATQADANAFLKAFKSKGFAWTYWRWTSEVVSPSGTSLGNVVYDSDTTQPTRYLNILVKARDTVY